MCGYGLLRVREEEDVIMAKATSFVRQFRLWADAAEAEQQLEEEANRAQQQKGADVRAQQQKEAAARAELQKKGAAVIVAQQQKEAAIMAQITKSTAGQTSLPAGLMLLRRAEKQASRRTVRW